MVNVRDLYVTILDKLEVALNDMDDNIPEPVRARWMLGAGGIWLGSLSMYELVELQSQITAEMQRKVE